MAIKLRNLLFCPDLAIDIGCMSYVLSPDARLHLCKQKNIKSFPISCGTNPKYAGDIGSCVEIYVGISRCKYVNVEEEHVLIRAGI